MLVKHRSHTTFIHIIKHSLIQTKKKKEIEMNVFVLYSDAFKYNNSLFICKW